MDFEQQGYDSGTYFGKTKMEVEYLNQTNI